MTLSQVFQIPTASKDAYKKSFFPQTIRDWNVLPDSLISSAELSDDCVSKFTSLVRARDSSSSANPLVRYCYFGVSPVSYSDSDYDSSADFALFNFEIAFWVSVSSKTSVSVLASVHNIFMC